MIVPASFNSELNHYLSKDIRQNTKAGIGYTTCLHVFQYNHVKVSKELP